MTAVSFFRWMITAVLVVSTSLCNATPIFSQLSSSKNQVSVTPVNLAFLETVDGIDNIGNAPTNITVKKPGFYFLLAAGQAGAVNSMAMADGNQYVDMWFIKNGVPVPNSTSRITVGQFITGTVVIQNLMSLNLDDKLSVGFSASAPGYGLVATPSKGNEPAIASIVFTLYKIE